MRVFYIITPVGTDSDLVGKIFYTVGTIMDIKPMVGLTNSDTLKVTGILRLPPYDYDNYIVDHKGFKYSVEPNKIYHEENKYIIPIIAPHDVSVITSGSFDMYREMVRWKDELSDHIEIYPILIEQPPNTRFNNFMACYVDPNDLNINEFHQMIAKFQELDKVFSVFDNNQELLFKFDDYRDNELTSAIVMHIVDHIYSIKNGKMCDSTTSIVMYDELEEKVLNS